MSQPSLATPQANDALYPALSSHPLRRAIKEALVALSLANLWFIAAWFSLLYDSDLGYYNKLPVKAPSLLALAANLLWSALFAWLVLRALHRWQNRWLHLTVHLLFLLLLLVPLNFVCHEVLQLSDHEIVAFLKRPLVFFFGTLVAAGVLWQHRRAAQAVAVLIGILCPLAFLTWARICLLLLGIQHLAQNAGDPALPPTTPVAPGQPRVLWIIFDEMDYRLAFEQRPAGVALPEFDRFRLTALFATQAFPPADSTLVSMPSLISGRRFSSVTIKNASDLTVTAADTGVSGAWSEMPSVFTSARQLGVNTGLVGWFHPYSRVLAHGLNYCAWFPIAPAEPTHARTFGASFVRQLCCLAENYYYRKLHLDNCRSCLAESVPLATNNACGLVLLHLPPPHKPGIYLPAEKRFTILGLPKVKGYLNNLALADRCLGTIRQALESSGQWERTWVILTADHSWRESQIFDGKRDHRVPFLVKGPGDNGPTAYAGEFNSVLTHDLILAMLRGEITNQANLSPWLDTQRAQPR